MNAHPVELDLTPAERMQRIHVLIRLLLLVALGAIGWSSLYWLIYLALPTVAALLIASKGGAISTKTATDSARCAPTD